MAAILGPREILTPAGIVEFTGQHSRSINSEGHRLNAEKVAIVFQELIFTPMGNIWINIKKGKK